MRRFACLFAVVAALLPCLTAHAAKPLTKWIEVEPLVNTHSEFMIAVDVDRPDRVYAEGEEMRVTVRAEEECFVYLVYYSGDGATLLFPNETQPDNHIPAKTPIVIPGDGADFRIRTTAPFGKEILHVVATKEKLESIGDIPADHFKELDTPTIKGMVVEVKKREQPTWAEARIDIHTVPSRDEGKIRQPKRLALCIGIGDYQSQRIQDLVAPPSDAERVAKALKAQCQVDDIELLVNEQATRAGIERAIFKNLVEKSQAGDTIFIYYSGHGGRTSDEDGDEEGDDNDGYDEYLVPHDGVFAKPDTMILDDVFARWMQELSGRTIAVMFDNCYAGGSSKGIRGIGPAKPRGEKFHGVEKAMMRAKALGQRDMVVIAACTPDERAWETSTHGGVLTHYLLESLNSNDSDLDGDGTLTVQEAYQFIRKDIEDYVASNVQEKQRPMIFDNAEQGVMLRKR